MTGKLAVIAIVLAALLTGGGIWYTQEYYYYQKITPGSAASKITIATPDGEVPLDTIAFEGIDADSSPLRWRACAQMSGTLPDAVPFDDPTPLVGPNWFECFDAAQIGADLESGAAKAVLSRAEIHPDVDRILAVYPDGKIFGWHQYNDKSPERGVMD